MDPHPNSSGVVSLFTWSGGTPRWFSIRLFAQVAGSGGGGAVDIKLNGATVSTEVGALGGTVGVGVPRHFSAHLLLNDGDVVSAQVDGDPLDLIFEASLDSSG
jgi:hypothetical protein